MINPILVPLDGSIFGEHALPVAVTMAKRLDAPLVLVHVHSLLCDATAADLQSLDLNTDDKMRAREEGYLQGIQKQVQERFSVPVTISVIGGDCPGGEVAAVLCKQADSLRAGFVVITTHARGPLGRIFWGSTTDELVRCLPIPLIAVHGNPAAPNLNTEQPIRHILVPLDGTPVVEDILETVVPIAKAMGAELTLLSAAPASKQTGTSAYLETVADRLRQGGLSVYTHVSVGQQPGAAILEFAKPPIDMIAIEKHGQSGVSRLLLGCVTDKVFHGSLLPILVKKPRK